MSVLGQTELDHLSVMYDGDKNRDASDKIRGFLFQDYVTINCLLQDHVEYVCSEYLEDVDVFYDNGRFEFIQVKYYPKTPVESKMKEISTDLYYQYLRLQMLKSTLEAVPRLYIHTTPKIVEPSSELMKSYIGTGEMPPKSPSYDTSQDAAAWLRTNVNILNKKDAQKSTLFSKMASIESLDEFCEVYQIAHEEDIQQYRKDLMDKLDKAYPNPDVKGDKQRWKSILLGLAISYVQQRYILDTTDFNEIRIDKRKFDQHITENTRTKTEQTIASYLVDVVCEEYGVILHENKESFLELHTYILEQIFQNTVQWINKIGATIEGQYQLVNTLSTKDADALADYKARDIESRLIEITQCYDNFKLFLDYLWKIMLDICQEKVHSISDLSAHKKLLDPSCYNNASVKDYICLDFPEDRFARRSVILPPAGRKFASIKRKLVERMVKVSPKPAKWYFENNGLMHGKNYYSYTTANVNEMPTVADLGEDSFYIECMECIKIDMGKWCSYEKCTECIFSEKCIKEGMGI